MTRGTPPRVGVFGIGLAAYWPQFEGLRERLAGYQRGLEARLSELGADVVSAGLVDTPERACRGGRSARRGARRPRDALHGDVRDVVAGAARRAGREGTGRDPQPAAHPVAGLREHDDWRVARKLLGLLRARASGSVHTRRHPVPHGHGNARRRRRCLERDERLDRRRACGPKPARRAVRVPRPHLSRDAGHVLRLHAGAGAGGLARRGARDGRPRGAGRRRPNRKRSRGRAPRSARCSSSRSLVPIRSRTTSLQRASSGPRASRSGSTGSSRTSPSTGSPTTTAGLGDNINERVGAGLIVGNSLLTAGGIPTSGEGDLKTNIAMFILDRLGAGGSYTEFYALDFDEEFVLMGHDGPGPRRDRGRSAGAARAQALPRQVGRGPLGGVQGAPRAGDDPRPLADRRRTAQAARRRGRVDRGPDLPDRQHELAHPLRAGHRARSWTPGAPKGRRTTSRWASGTSRRGSARSRTCSGSSWRWSSERALPRPGHRRVRRERPAARGEFEEQTGIALEIRSSRATSTSRTGSTTCSTATVRRTSTCRAPSSSGSTSRPDS